jgi:hypothetical protein
MTITPVISELREEPTFTILQGKGKEMSLKVTTVADFIKYQLDTLEIVFSSTMMFERRITDCQDDQHFHDPI